MRKAGVRDGCRTAVTHPGRGLPGPGISRVRRSDGSGDQPGPAVGRARGSAGTGGSGGRGGAEFVVEDVEQLVRGDLVEVGAGLLRYGQDRIVRLRPVEAPGQLP